MRNLSTPPRKVSRAEPDQKRIEAAKLAGFELIDGQDAPGQLGYFATEAELLRFAKQCEAAGRAQIALALRIVVAKGSASPAVANALTIAADIADAWNKRIGNE